MANKNIGFTAQLAAHAHAIRFDTIPPDILELAAHCILDFTGLAIVSAHEPLIEALRQDAVDQGGRAYASAVGCGAKLPDTAAAGINAAAGHVLAFDDVNMAIPGHGTAVAFPAALATAEPRGASGRDLLQAYVAGFETVGAVAALVGPGHYDRGFHASGTLGTFGASAAAGHVMGLTPEQLQQAISVAGSMAAGLKGVFGSMLKPFQVSRAASNGVLAARLVSRGLRGRGDLLEAGQGFAEVLAGHEATRFDPPAGFYLSGTLFKYHAACYLAHSAIECSRDLRNRMPLTAENVHEVVVEVNPMAGKTCNMPVPSTGPEIGYSLPMLTAMGLLGHEVSRVDSLDPALLADPALAALREKVVVRLQPGLPETESRVTLLTTAGERLATTHDVGLPVTDRALQCRRLQAKFVGLVEPVLGGSATRQAMEQVVGLDRLPTVAPLADLLRTLGVERQDGQPRAA